jgi:hypothetical protein
MGSPKYGIVGESQSVLITINPIISPRPRTATLACVRPSPQGLQLERSRGDGEEEGGGYECTRPHLPP